MVALHPLVIINISDHYTRVKVNGEDPNPCVLGVLLGVREANRIELFDSFECITAENVINMAEVRERLSLHQECYKEHGILGWYCTHNEIEDLHKDYHKQFLRETDGDASMVLMLDVELAQTSKRDLPIYACEHELRHQEDGSSAISFGRVPFKVETADSERVSVDHVAHARPSGAGSSTVAHLARIRGATDMLRERVLTVLNYLKAVEKNEVEPDYAMLRQVKSLVDMLPAMNTSEFRSEAVTEYNDNLLQIYLATLMKSTNQLNGLVDHYNVAYDRNSRMRLPGLLDR